MPALSSKTSGVLTTEHISEDVPENIIHISVTAVKVIFPVGSAAVPAAETKASETVAETASRILSHSPDRQKRLPQRLQNRTGR